MPLLAVLMTVGYLAGLVIFLVAAWRTMQAHESLAASAQSLAASAQELLSVVEAKTKG